MKLELFITLDDLSRLIIRLWQEKTRLLYFFLLSELNERIYSIHLDLAGVSEEEELKGTSHVNKYDISSDYGLRHLSCRL